MRVDELGIYTFGSGWSKPGVQAEVGRLVFSNAGVLFDVDDLRATGTFKYKDRPATLTDWRRNNPLKAVLHGIIGILVSLGFMSMTMELAGARKREKERRNAEHAREQAAREAALADLRRTLSEAQETAASLPIVLAGAELLLDKADHELRAKLASPFWEAIEDAVAKLEEFRSAMTTIQSLQAQYSAGSSRFHRALPAFEIGVAILPDPTRTHRRLTSLYRQAQAIPHFSLVYEQRRTTATLVAGFRSLGQAVEHLGERIVDQLGSLAAALGAHLDSLEKSLESSAAAAAEQNAALRRELRRAADKDEGIVHQLREDAETRAESERLALRMLDNIQRRRKPTLFDHS